MMTDISLNRAALAMSLAHEVLRAKEALADFHTLVRYRTPCGEVSGYTGSHNQGRYCHEVYKLDDEGMVRCATLAGLSHARQKDDFLQTMMALLDPQLKPQLGDLLIVESRNNVIHDMRLYKPEDIVRIFGNEWHPAVTVGRILENA